MGSNSQEDHHQSIVMNSHEEEVHDQENEELGVGRSYECVYCKRGFNTAQALGGHMNIHRKDRAFRSRTSTKPYTNTITSISNEYSNNQEQILYTGPRLYQQIISLSSPIHYHHHQPRLNNMSYHGTASTYNNMNRPLFIGNDNEYSDIHDHYRQPSDQIMVPADNWRLRLSLEFSPMMEMNRSQALELRLGYDP